MTSNMVVKSVSPLSFFSYFYYYSNSCWAGLLPPALTAVLRRSPPALSSPCSSFPAYQFADWASKNSPSDKEEKKYVDLNVDK